MPEEMSVLSHHQKDTLFTKLREDPKFRELMKKDWRAALTEVNIKPESVVKGTLSRQEIENFAQQRAGWEIIIIIFDPRSALERVSLGEAVNMAAR